MASFLGLPSEILELVFARLDFKGMCSLRLVCRDLAARTPHGVVQSDFAMKTAAWYPTTEVQELKAKTAQGWKGCLMTGLTIVGLVDGDDRIPVDDAQAQQQALTQAFINIRRHAPRGYLDELVLRVQSRFPDVIRTVTRANIGRMHDWNHIWEAAGRVSEASMRALAASGLPIRRLDLFGTKSPRYALACDRLRNLLSLLDATEGGLRRSLQPLTDLSLGLSGSVAVQPQGEGLGDRHEHPIAALVASCPSLTSLHIRWYNIGSHGIADILEEETAFVHQLAYSSGDSLGRLRVCHLQGAHTTGQDLLAFLHCMPMVQSLILDEVHLVEGRFEPIFQFLTSEALEHLERIILDDLWEEYTHIYFDAPGQPHYPRMGNTVCPHNLIWNRTSPREAIKYGTPSGRPYGSPALRSWRQRRRKLYGVIDRHD